MYKYDPNTPPISSITSNSPNSPDPDNPNGVFNETMFQWCSWLKLILSPLAA